MASCWNRNADREVSPGGERFQEQLTSLALKGGEVEVFPENPGYHLNERGEPDTMAARDSLALEEVATTDVDDLHPQMSSTSTKTRKKTMMGYPSIGQEENAGEVFE